MSFFDPTQHHAFVVSGYSVEDVENLLRTTFDMTESSHPDFFLGVYTTFGIDDARLLRSKASASTFSGGQKVFLISFHSITHEAQNALLKILEEPTPKTLFVFVVPRVNTLLPTLLSRVELITASSDGDLKEAETFMQKTLKDKIEYVGLLIQEGDRLKASHFILSLIMYLRSKGVKNTSALTELVEIYSYTLDPSSSLKLLLEHSACVVDST